jgi:hypothetical protein
MATWPLLEQKKWRELGIACQMNALQWIPAATVANALASLQQSTIASASALLQAQLLDPVAPGAPRGAPEPRSPPVSQL